MFSCSFAFLCVTSSVSFAGFYTEDKPTFELKPAKLACQCSFKVHLTTASQCFTFNVPLKVCKRKMLAIVVPWPRLREAWVYSLDDVINYFAL